jgi:hypothetical protein
MIRHQQATIQTLQNQTAPSNTTTSAVDDSTPTSERSMSLNHATVPPPLAQPNTSSTTSAPRPRSPFIPHSLSRHSSYRSGRSSHDASPSLHPTAGYANLPNEGTDMVLGSSVVRDESAFYQAETQNLTRENQMLKHRIRELGMFLPKLGRRRNTAHLLTTGW